MEAVQHARPQDGLRGGDVVPDDKQAVGDVHVRIRPRLPVATKALPHRRGGGGRAQARVAVHVEGTEAGLAHHRQRVVLFEEQLPRAVEGDAVRRQAGGDLARLVDDARHGLVPRRRPQLAIVAAHQGGGQAVGAVVGDPAVETFGAEAAAVDAVVGAAADADDAAVLDTDVEGASVAAEDAGGLDPAVGGGGDAGVDAGGPVA